MVTINKISRDDVPAWLFNEFISDYVEESYSEHRRGSNFFTNWIIEVSEKEYPQCPQYHGFWETNTFIHDTEHGFDKTEIYELTRVVKKTKLVEVTTWEAAQDDSEEQSE